jgi:hypothetical protein
MRLRWLAAQAHETVILRQTVQPRGIFAPRPTPPVKPAAAADYLEVAQKMLFSKDRNPTAAIEVPAVKPPPPEPPMPPLPNFHGMMDLFGDSVIILSVGKDASQKSYRAGDEVGPFKLIAFDRESVTFEWRGKTVNAPVDKLVAKVEPPPPAAAVAQQQAAAAPQVTTLAPAAPSAAVSLGSADGNKPPPALGVDMGGGFRACATGDTTPPGTVLNGYRKVVAATLMGNSCHWELVK